MVWKLLDAGEDVVVIDRLSTGFRWAVARQRHAFYLGDVADETLLQKIFAENDIDAIIHFAGSAVVPASIEDPLAYYDNNTGKTRILVSAAINAGIRRFDLLLNRRRLRPTAVQRTGAGRRAAYGRKRPTASQADV